MSTINTGGPAFPGSGPAHPQRNGMTLRQYAAIKLKVPDSGTEWLDAMIAESLRDEFSARAMQAYLSGPDRDSFTHDEWAVPAYEMADAMMKAKEA